MLEVFVGPPPAGALGLHRDDDRLNNSLENLYWGDWVSNSKDRHQNGRANVGEKNGQARLTDEQVAEIFRRRRQGELLTSIAKDFNISPSNVSAIGVGRSWAWLTGQR
jgi:DNA-binding NarL/FixJ family response regulator